MEISLIKSQDLNFKLDLSANNGGNPRRVDRQSVLTPSITPIPGFRMLTESPDDNESDEWPNKRPRIEPKPAPLIGDLFRSEDTDETLLCEGSVYLGGPDVRIHCRIIPSHEFAFQNCFTELENSFGANNLSFNVHVKLYDGTVHEKKDLLLHRKFYENGTKKLPLAHLIFPLVITSNLELFSHSWREAHCFNAGTISVTAISNEQGMKTVLRNKNAGPAWATRKLLEEGILTDATIVVGNGAQIKCHKSYLAVHSPVFRRMFESKMVEGLTGTVNLSQMTESGAKALLSFLYCWELDEAAADCLITFELLQVACEYNVATLEKALRELILTRDAMWFTIPFILDLLHFAKKKIDNEKDVNYEKIKAKALKVFKLKPLSQVHECPEFQQLFPDSDAGGMELCLMLLQSK